MTMEMQLCGAGVTLRPDGSLYWPARGTLVVADLHFGKADTFRAAALPVPGGAAGTLARLAAALTDTGATRLVVLGDFWHARAGRTARLLTELAAWRAARPALAIDLVRGNHDRAGAPPAGWAASWLAEPVVDPPFGFAHFPEPSPAGYVLAGHLHPGVTVAGRGREVFRLPCFWFGPAVGVLPAFGSFTGTSLITPAAGDTVAAVAGDQLILIPT